MKLLVPLAALLLTLAGLSAAHAGRGGPGAGGDHGGPHRHLARLLHGDQRAPAGMLERHLDQLAERAGLGREQRRHVARLFAASDLPERAEALLAAHAAQARAIHAEPLDEAAVRSASRSVGQAQEELAVSLARLLHEVHGNLEESQLERLAGHHSHLLSAAHEHLRAARGSLDAWIERNL